MSCSQKSSPTALQHPHPPTKSPSILSPGGHCKFMGCFEQAGGGQNCSGEKVTRQQAELIAEPHKPLFQLARASYHLLSHLPDLWRRDSPHGGGRFNPAVSVFPISRLNPQIWPPRKFPQQPHFGVVLYSHKPNSIWERCSALASELERKQACKGLLGYSPSPMDSHETSLMYAIAGNLALPCFEDQLPNLSPVFPRISSLLGGRDNQRTPHHVAGELYPGFHTDLPAGPPWWDPSQRRAHISSSHCLPAPQTFGHGMVQKPSSDTMPAQSSLQDPCLISPQHLKADFG